MKHLAKLAIALAGAIIGATLAVFVAPVSGQIAVSSVPRLTNGKPDLNGIWQALNEAIFDIQMHVARPALALRAGPYGPVPAAPVVALGAVGAVPPGVGVVEGDLPYRPEALATKRENQANWLTRDPEIKCYLPGVPRATYMPHPFQIAHSASSLLISYQYAGAVRDVFVKDPGPAPVDSWMGQSVGRWDGDTLVIDVTGFNDQTWFDRAGNFHSDALHVVERYTRQSRDVIAYEATIEDPKVFTRPWKMSMALYRRQEPDAQLMDFKCVEFVEELMFGQWRKNPLSR
jgi:hypothetical protein